MDDVLRALREWFALRNEVWLTGDSDELERTGVAARAIVEEMRRRQRLQERRGAKEQKVIVDAAVLSADGARDGSRVRVKVAEHVRFLYELDGELEHEQRVLQHEITFARSRDDIVMRAHRCLTEADVSQHGSAASDGQEDGPTASVGSSAGDPAAGAAGSSGPAGPPGNPPGRAHAAQAIEALGAMRDGGYDRIRAWRYAERWWNARNPEYQDMGVDCTNYISQTMAAGGLPQHATGRRDSGWWYRAAAHPAWSYSWAVANAFAHYLQRRDNRVRAVLVQNPRELKLGDVICYDWQGNGAYNHSTVVTAHDAAGDPLVNAHTVNSHKRYFSYEDSYAWTEHTRYLFVHFAD